MKHAFTLVELSIVLVILGLLVGGVLAGQNLIRAAELRSVTTEFTNYQTAVMTFKEKYFALPGDMDNATAFWGSATCMGTAGTGTQTCDGDGDGTIEYAGAAGEYGEFTMFWQHLANAGLLEGTYTGIAGGSSVYHSIIGENIPESRVSNAGWGIVKWGATGATNTRHYDDVYDNTLLFGEQKNFTPPETSTLTPEEAWNIDTKMDDGMPATGKVLGFHDDGWNNAGGTLERCSLSQSGTDKAKDYALSVDSKRCALHFMRVF